MDLASILVRTATGSAVIDDGVTFASLALRHLQPLPAELAVVDLVLALGVVQNELLAAHEAVLECDRMTLRGVDAKRVSVHLDAAVIRRKRLAIAATIVAASLIDRTASVPSFAHAYKALPPTASTALDHAHNIAADALASPLPLSQLLAATSPPAEGNAEPVATETMYQQLFGISGPPTTSADADAGATKSGYVPRYGKSGAAGTAGGSKTTPGALVNLIDALCDTVARGAVLRHVGYAHITLPAASFATGGGGGGGGGGPLSSPLSDSGSSAPGIASAATKTFAVPFVRPKPTQLPVLVAELQPVLGPFASTVVLDCPAEYYLPLLKRASHERLAEPRAESLITALQQPHSDVGKLLASRELSAALTSSGFEGAKLLEHNKEVFVALVAACFRAGERSLLESLWGGLSSQPPTEPACHALRELCVAYGAPAPQRPTASSAAKRRVLTAAADDTTGAARLAATAGPADDFDDDEWVDARLPPDSNDPNSIFSAAIETRLAVGDPAVYPRCLTADMLGGAVVGMVAALRASPPDRHARLAKLLSLVLRPILKRREPPVPLFAATVLNGLCLEHTENKDLQALYLAVRQSFNLPPAGGGGVSASDAAGSSAGTS